MSELKIQRFPSLHGWDDRRNFIDLYMAVLRFIHGCKVPLAANEKFYIRKIAGIQEFHRRYYHPSNARIWFYGDDDPNERLRILSEYLDMFDASSAPSESRIEPQKLFSEPVRIVEKYPAAEGNIPKVEELIMNTLKNLAEEGFDSDAVEASMNTIEFSLRENNTGSFPRGLALMLRSIGKWVYDMDPFQPLKY